MQLARYANVSCFVCRADYTPKANIAMLDSLALENKLPNACVVLNGVDMSKNFLIVSLGNICVIQGNDLYLHPKSIIAFQL